MTLDAYNSLGFLWFIAWILWLRQDRTPQAVKTGVFYAGGLGIILFSGLPFDVMAVGSISFAIRSLIMASVPISFGMILHVKTFKSSPQRIPVFPVAYSAVVTIAFVYLINLDYTCRFSPMDSRSLRLVGSVHGILYPGVGTLSRRMGLRKGSRA